MAETTKRHRTFGSRNKKASKAPVTFDIEGVDTEDNEYVEAFTARPTIPGIAIMEFADKGASGAGMGAMLELYEAAMEEEEYKRFDKFVHDPKNIVELETLTELAGYLVEEYTSRPTKAS